MNDNFVMRVNKSNKRADNEKKTTSKPNLDKTEEGRRWKIFELCKNKL